jgi:hypothetical protein
VGPQAKAPIHEELKRVLQECTKIGYNAGYFRNDLANSDPAELCMRYTMNPPTDGYMRLCREDRLDLAVENVVWKFRQDFPPDIVKQARRRLADFGFDVVTQRASAHASG